MPKRSGSNGLVRHKMIGWYDPIQLGRTAVEVLISTIFGRHADKRIMQALADTGELQKQYFYEVTGREDQEFWFDYISDVGDGFDPTYTMAYNIAKPTLAFEDPRSVKPPDDKPIDTVRGELLLFGGDEVYPTASFREYKERLTSLYESVFPEKVVSQTENGKAQQGPLVFAIPGNHDWYDSLVAFTDLFCEKRSFGGWRTLQNRSYFALKLPRGWWVFGTDMQLGSSLDKAQISYFSRVMKFVAPDDRIILCNAEPHWITEKMYRGDPAYDNRNLGYFEGGVLRHQTAIYVAGDRHYYRRHEEIKNGKKDIDPGTKSKVQKFVAGGGGAFLHPTHGEKVETVGRRHIFELRKSFPEADDSKLLTFRNLAFPFFNWKFGILTGLLYLLTAQAFLVGLGRFSLDNLAGAVGTVATAALTQPVALFWVILLFAAFVLFTDPHSKPFRWIAGSAHAAVHLIVLFVFSWAAAYLTGGDADLRSRGLAQLLITAGLIFATGAILGSFLMGVYLLVSLNLCCMHHNEAFSSLKIKDYKNFLRFKIDADSGNLTIFPVGIRRVVRNWKDGGSGEPRLVPADEKAENTPFLIEEPIVFEKAARIASSSVNNIGSKPGPSFDLVVERSLAGGHNEDTVQTNVLTTNEKVSA